MHFADFIFFVSIFATLLGAITGMGGGVIIKPVLDMLGHYDVASISMLSSFTVFAMSAVSLFRQRKSTQKPPIGIAVPLAVGAVVGGNVGGALLDVAVRKAHDGLNVTLLQNIGLALLIIFVFVYMVKKKSISTLHCTNPIASFGIGMALGGISSFLGIGGGPINVALIIFMFSFPTKTATFSSLLIVLFSQAAKLATTALFVGFSSYNLAVLPTMLLGGVGGGYIGGTIAVHLDEKKTDKLFNAAQILVFCMCIVNIVGSL